MNLNYSPPRAFCRAALLMFLACAIFPLSARATPGCVSARFNDWKNLGCHVPPGPWKDLSLTPISANQSSCPTGDCTGMPRWWIDEPYVNLWMADTPLSYLTSSGKPMDFRFYYKQRYQLPLPDECPTLYQVANFPGSSRAVSDLYLYYQRHYGMTNAAWGHNWLSDITFWDQPWEVTDVNHNHGNPISPPTVFSQEYEALMLRPEGGIYYFHGSATSMTDPLSQAHLKANSGSYPVNSSSPSHDANNIYWGDAGAGFTMTYADGSRDVFDLSLFNYGPNYWIVGDSTSHAFLTQRIDAQGRTNHIGYEAVTFSSTTLFRVRYVVDPDNKTNTFQYVSGGAHPWQVSEIDDPYGRNATVSYNGSGVISGITDAVTNSSTFGYLDSSGWITILNTPYGATSFNFYQQPDPDGSPNCFIQRAAYVTEPEGAKQLFCYLHHTTNVADIANSPTNVPGQTFDDGTCGSSHNPLGYRDTFHFDRLQFTSLSGGVLYYLTNTPNVSSALDALTSADLKKCSTKHWLWQTNGTSLSESISSEREPCPDTAGSIEGPRTWYGYANKLFGCDAEGDPEISSVARLLDDGTTQYTIYGYSGNTTAPWPAMAQTSRSTFTKTDGTIGELTNYFAYAGNGIDLTSLSNSAGQFTKLAYNTNHEITFLTNSLSQVGSVSWDSSSHNLTGVTLPSGQAAGFGTGGFLTSLSPQGLSLSISDYTAGLPRTVRVSGTGLPDLWFTNSWDSLNRLTAVAFTDGSTVSNVYTNLDLIAAKDRLGHWTTFTHDGLQHLTSVVNARSNLTQFSWCGCGMLTGIIDALTNTTTIYHNNQGLETGILFADGSSLTNAFDMWGHRTAVSDGLGRGFTFGFSNQGLVTVVSNAFGTVSKRLFDSVNRTIVETDQNGVTVTNQWDLLSRLTLRTWQDGVSEGYGWATNGLIAVTNRDGQVTRFGRDAAGRAVSTTNANLEVVWKAFTARNMVSDLWDGKSNHTAWHFYPEGWVSNKVDAFNHEVFHLGRNANGQVTNRWTPEFGNTSYSLDANGNVTNTTYSGPTHAVARAFDKLDQMVQMSDGAGTTSLGWTPTGQLASEDGPWTSDTVNLTYAQQILQSISVQRPGAGDWQQTNVVDAAFRISTVTSPAGLFRYVLPSGAQAASSLIAGIALPNGASITNHFDSLGRMDYTALENYWGHVLDGYSYGTDPLGLRTNITRNLGLTVSTVSVGYDSIAQITSWLASETNGTARLNEQLGYGYDAAHNLASRTNGGLAQTFTDDGLNQLTNVSRSGASFTLSGNTPAPATNITVNGVTAQRYGDFTFAASGVTLTNGANTLTTIAANAYGTKTTNITSATLPSSVSLLYDSNGNLTNDGLKSFAYDAEDRMTNVWVPGTWKKEYQFDGWGRRRIEREYKWQSSNWLKTNETRFVYVGDLIFQERDTNNVVMVNYTRGADLSGTLFDAGGIGGLLARTDSTNGSLCYHTDGAGNVTALIDGRQMVQGRYLRDAFGRPLGQWGALASVNRMGFSSMPESMGMVHYPMRDYLPNVQRWSSRDPIREAGGLNLYRFVANSPLNFVDPFGTWEQLVSEPTPAQASDVAGDLSWFLRGLNDQLADLFQYPGTGVVGGEFESGIMSELSKDADNGLFGKLGGWLKKMLGIKCKPKAKIAPGAGYPSKSAGGTMYTGAYDSASKTLYLGDTGHANGMAAAGGTPAAGVTPGITVADTPSGVSWAADSPSLPATSLTQDDVGNIQAALEQQFPGKTVTQVPTIH